LAETQISLCSQALALIGAPPITSTVGSDARQVASAQLYEPIVGDILGLHRWHFASTGVELVLLGATTATRWANKYQLPTDVLMIHGVFVNDDPIEFDRFDDQIHCDATAADDVMLEYTRRVSETFWPVYFSSCVRLKLAAAFAIAIAQDSEKANVFEGKFIRQVAAARLADSQGRTASKLPVGRFAAIVQGRP
jgi:hypothetical protein